MNDEFPLIIIERYQTCSILMLSFISALHRVPLFMDRIWLLLVPVETEVDLHSANKVCGDSTRNEQVKTSVSRINFDGSSADIALFSSRKILVFGKILAKIVNVIQHTRSCLSIYWAAICFYSTMRNIYYIGFDKCFYNCDVVAETSLYVTFLIHE